MADYAKKTATIESHSHSGQKEAIILYELLLKLLGVLWKMAHLDLRGRFSPKPHLHS